MSNTINNTNETNNGNGELRLEVMLQPIPFAKTSGERGRPQTNARVYLTMVNVEPLKRKGYTEAQLRRRVFAQVREMLGLPRNVVFAHKKGDDFYMVKTRTLTTNVAITVVPVAA